MAGIILARKRGISGDVRDLDHIDRTLDSTVNQLKVYMSGGGTVNIKNETQGLTQKRIIEVEHGLGYQPFFAGWYKDHNGVKWEKIPSSLLIDISGTSVEFRSGMGRPNDDLIQLHFYTIWFMDPVFDVNIDYKYLIYVDPYRDAW